MERVRGSERKREGGEGARKGEKEIVGGATILMLLDKITGVSFAVPTRRRSRAARFLVSTASRRTIGDRAYDGMTYS